MNDGGKEQLAKKGKIITERTKQRNNHYLAWVTDSGKYYMKYMMESYVRSHCRWIDPFLCTIFVHTHS